MYWTVHRSTSQDDILSVIMFSMGILLLMTNLKLNLACNIHTGINTKFNWYENNDPLVVPTNYGYVRGFYLDNSTRAFYGIPYAVPPVGSLRWSRPAETLPWFPEVFNATEQPKACIQSPLSVSIFTVLSIQ